MNQTKAIELLNELDNYNPTEHGLLPSEDLLHMFRQALTQGDLFNDFSKTFESCKPLVELKLLKAAIGTSTPEIITKEWLIIINRTLERAVNDGQLSDNDDTKFRPVGHSIPMTLSSFRSQLAYMLEKQWDAVDTESKQVIWKLKFG